MYRVIIFLLLLTACSSVKESAHVYSKDGVALAGYDLISYFEGTPMKGDAQYQKEHKGVMYHFVSNEHAQEFINSPQKFLPQYGGYCAYAMAKNGSKVSINPETYEIRDNQLYLFYSNWMSNTLKKWNNEGPKKLIQQADKNWKKLGE